MAARKQREYELADWRLVYSEMHRRSFERAALPSNVLVTRYAPGSEAEVIALRGIDYGSRTEAARRASYRRAP